jgi:hypothetical protein
MLFTKTIRQLIALAMLVVFAFSITPQQVVHDMVAKHLDPTVCAVHKDVPVDQVENTKLHCTFDFQVATTAFTHFDFTLSLQAPATITIQNATYKEAALASIFFHQSSRGPPAMMKDIV